MPIADDFTIKLNRRDAEFLLRALDNEEFRQSTQQRAEYSEFVEAAARCLREALREGR
ncbi:hypothetical protein EVC08_020 [Rhizobium phage RHph_N65]|nr:hypothetical protein EVC08_020 [Rhizobium phage RHph_N65]